MVSDITWKIGGEAGFGIMVSGHNMARTMVRGGLFIFESNEYPSLIRGGHNTETVRISTEPVHSLLPAVHILVALNKQTQRQRPAMSL
ncbi:2-oxoacid:acceptor oxidoreductase family protein [Candidatus Gottesmanbacteria bacterium]|nr:2-oxoacid:acceptor oxidoreductase family protein [Candidatus Gottesmanbacteria bacterium]